LIKPQFEAGRQEVSRGRGVIRDEAIRERIIGDILEVVVTSGFGVVADAPCEVLGPKGNREHFFYARKT
jgi:23S rRNA (cytidine1920-2'-O)/16S rRNA (cytidine1409-2'-O)-methyltransferase